MVSPQTRVQRARGESSDQGAEGPCQVLRPGCRGPMESPQTAPICCPEGPTCDWVVATAAATLSSHALSLSPIAKRPEEGIATHSSILAWRIPPTEGPSRLHSLGSQKLHLTEAIEHTAKRPALGTGSTGKGQRQPHTPRSQKQRTLCVRKTMAPHQPSRIGGESASCLLAAAACGRVC